MRSNTLVIIFSRPAVLGKVKTRLARDIGAAKALLLHQKLFSRTTALVEALGVDKKLYLADPPGLEFKENYELQEGRNLGERMAAALERELQARQKVVLIGSDCLDLTKEDLRQAISELEDNDLVLGPARDGGYYLIGMNQFTPEVFENIDWGSNKVLHQTLTIARELTLKTALLKTRRDIDTIDDLPANWIDL